MKKLSLAGCALAIFAAFVGCASDSSEYAAGDSTLPPGQAGGAMDNSFENQSGATTATTSRPTTNEPKPWSNSSGGSSTPAAAKYPVAKAVAGKPGLVKSPYAPYAGDVDVKGIASGTQVKCPYTGKIFIVP